MPERVVETKERARWGRVAALVAGVVAAVTLAVLDGMTAMAFLGFSGACSMYEDVGGCDQVGPYVWGTAALAIVGLATVAVGALRRRLGLLLIGLVPLAIPLAVFLLLLVSG